MEEEGEYLQCLFRITMSILVFLEYPELFFSNVREEKVVELLL
jgi:hypothetical protein